MQLLDIGRFSHNFAKTLKIYIMKDLSYDVLDLTELSSSMDSDTELSGCAICNGQCKGQNSGCFITNGKCDDTGDDPNPTPDE